MMDKIWAISHNTFRESIRSKVLYATILIAFLLMAVTTILGSVTIGDQIKVVKDFGLFSVSIFSVAFAVISGAALLFKELSKKTIYNILSKSVARWEFLLGKYLGMLLTTLSIISILGFSLILYLYYLEGHFDPLILLSMYYTFLELVIVCAAAIFFSSIVVTPILSGLFTFGIFLAGRSVDYLLYFVQHGVAQGSGKWILETLSAGLPNLDKINIANDVVFLNFEAFGIERLVWSSIYCLSYAGILLVLASIAFRRREFN